ncbi:hypothetical protein NA2_10608 [Nitratireductor pacificus pht-3B]|uniref:Immunity MXAN-0049 protein domain-containing protein n=1 Tax=Nitratireductor pacificus pht-3B TaxID=391937 RepID=K2MDQ6_9HYPH|nr:hypothetical protein NA2_10608 [Nitratireductor pacificus pht-3B]
MVTDRYPELEKMLDAGARRIPWWRRPIKALHVTETDDRQTRRTVDAPWMGSHGLVVKPAARAVLEPLFGAAAQFVPVRGTPYPGLDYVHVHHLVNVLDEERSEIVYFTPGADILEITRHVFLPEIASAGPVFKLSRLPRGSIFLRDDVVEAILTSNLTGFAFEKVWSNVE